MELHTFRRTKKQVPNQVSHEGSVKYLKEDDEIMLHF